MTFTLNKQQLINDHLALTTKRNNLRKYISDHTEKDVILLPQRELGMLWTMITHLNYLETSHTALIEYLSESDKVKERIKIVTKMDNDFNHVLCNEDSNFIKIGTTANLLDLSYDTSPSKYAGVDRTSLIGDGGRINTLLVSIRFDDTDPVVCHVMMPEDLEFLSEKNRGMGERVLNRNIKLLYGPFVLDMDFNLNGVLNIYTGQLQVDGTVTTRKEGCEVTLLGYSTELYFDTEK